MHFFHDCVPAAFAVARNPDQPCSPCLITSVHLEAGVTVTRVTVTVRGDDSVDIVISVVGVCAEKVALDT